MRARTWLITLLVAALWARWFPALRERSGAFRPLIVISKGTPVDAEKLLDIRQPPSR